ncbi:hypothetical protein COS54_00850 [Candidatus Shapirobacteria bacterium CG03_land_8_20_14_0_80_39_12]|uniref:TNase-like domain-containing protein n=1 Tax=Candidatus Shapirobacteria bacterium CG03_land_8_20_14_0_80_39_12 TaxID=1974879 RepID=A0A2M7BEG4_9BACT|nr:MAG: hypothetical protein COS54_00850 [Candidatus Shapirobacteria bacterium CG03_land_8_20_14_0_80_39_12]
MDKKFIGKILPFLGFFLFIISLVFNVLQYSKNKSLSQGTKVIGVIDGDTIVLEGKARLRLRNIDAPELGFCGGTEAKDLLEKLVNNKTIIFKEKILDQKGRAMALIYIDNLLINKEMLKSGWARYHSDQSTAAEELKATANKAKTDGLGIFSSKCYQIKNPDNPKCVIKGNIDKNSDLKNYYFPGCPQYEFTIVEKDLGENWFCTEKEAQAAGFTRAKNCPKDL